MISLAISSEYSRQPGRSVYISTVYNINSITYYQKEE